MKNVGMLRLYLFLGALLFASLIVFASTPNAFGCGATNDNSPSQCVLAQVTSTVDVANSSTPTATVTLTTTLAVTLFQTSTVTTTLGAAQLVTPTATPRPTTAPMPTPRGDSPETARDPFYVRPQNCINAMCPEQVGAPSLTSSTDWTWIDPNSTIWYKMDDGHGFQLEIWLFANGQNGFSFEVYAPDQQDLYGKPIGRGSFNKNMANIGADLFYSGRTQAHGVWHLRVDNNTSIPMAFSLKFTRTIPTMSNVCDSCHKLIGTDWGSCTGDMCQSLHDYYDTNPTCYDHNVDADFSGGCGN